MRIGLGVGLALVWVAAACLPGNPDSTTGATGDSAGASSSSSSSGAAAAAASSGGSAASGSAAGTSGGVASTGGSGTASSAAGTTSEAHAGAHASSSAASSSSSGGAAASSSAGTTSEAHSGAQASSTSAVATATGAAAGTGSSSGGGSSGGSSSGGGLDVCQDLAGEDFGICRGIVGYGVVNGVCVSISGCGCDSQTQNCAALHTTQEACEQACGCTGAYLDELGYCYRSNGGVAPAECCAPYDCDATHALCASAPPPCTAVNISSWIGS
jgi:hypothetical protein